MPQPEKIPSAFAHAGDVQKIPEAKPEKGRASWNDGFPPETQIPLAAGGLAPQRKDFNGIFNALSEIALWAQQGGKYIHDKSVNYEPGNVILDGGGLYFCVKANGPGSTVKAPAADNGTYWKLIFDKDGALNVPKVKTLTMAEVLQKVYPVGSVYVSAVATPPATLFGFGTWEQIKDKFILAASGTHAALSTGGEEKHTLLASEMPVHTHAGTLAQGGAHTHSGTAASAGDHHHVTQGESDNDERAYWGVESNRHDYYGRHGGTDKDNYRYNTSTAGAHTHTLNINSGGGHTHTLTAANAGGGAAHNNMPPYIALYVWRRTA